MNITRRRVLRGLVNGAGVSVALPFLDCFLNGNGTALANGAPLPVRFGTWFWGCGHNPGRAISEKIGREWEFLEECKWLTPYKKDINFFSGYKLPTDGRTNFPHITGLTAIRTGVVPVQQGDVPAPTLDVLIADAIGNGTRFRSLEATATGNARDGYSARGTGNINAPEVSPVALYNRIFGAEFADPNKADFKPDPKIMLRQSVLSFVKDQSSNFSARLGAADKARMEEYFTSIRQLEQQLELQMQKPPPAEACAIPKAANEMPPGTEVDTVHFNHRLMAQLLAMAVACNQTKVINMTYSASTTALRRKGQSATHHTTTHEEPIDRTLGYQPITSWFVGKSMEALAAFIQAFASIREGGGTVLDNTLLFAYTDTSYAKIHALDGVPMMTIGKAGGRVKTGLHVASSGDPVTAVGLTAQQVMGLQVDKWGAKSLQTGKTVSEILA